MEDYARTLAQMEKEMTSAEKELNILKGKKSGLVSTLKSNFNVSTVKEAKVEVGKLETKKVEASKKLNRLINDLRDAHDWSL